MAAGSDAMADRGRVLVLAGGLCHEREVSLRSGRRVAEALRARGVEVEVRDVDALLLPALRADPPWVVFPVLHGAVGEDGAVREVLESLGVPYVGAVPAAARLAFDKPTAKTLTGRVGLRSPRGVALPHQLFRELGAQVLMDALVDQMGLPLMVKPTRGGSALGASVVREPADLATAMMGCFAYSEVALVEQYITGTEVAVAVVDVGDGPVALPPIEIVPDAGVYDYHARYTAGATEFFVPQRRGPSVDEECRQVALTAHRTLGLRDVSRTDLIVDAAGMTWFLEANVAPGMTETSLLPMAAEAAGLDVGQLYLDLCRVAGSRRTTAAV